MCFISKGPTLDRYCGQDQIMLGETTDVKKQNQDENR